jgi:hypothetical protein
VYQGREDVQVGTLLTWADRILASVQEGGFLSAIDTTRMYYLGKAPGNTNGLPDDPAELRTLVGEKMRELMVASMRYAFSEDRMTDATHYTPDGRGVDRTALFEGLVATFARACIALDDFDLLWEDLFGEYDDAGIARIYLEQLETFVLDNDIRYVPPRITQRLVAMHAADRRPDRAERVIWHLDPECLDINQSIRLCRQYELYDALIHVYTRALRDYRSPLVDLLALVRRVMQFRRAMRATRPTAAEEHAMEPVFVNAYKIFPYLANVLSGLAYPSAEPLGADEAEQAKHDVYTFLFFGRSSVWPEGEGGALVLTAEDEGGMEPTYPYARLLARFDAEAFLHALDLAFEDSYFNTDACRISRLVITKIVLEILADTGPLALAPADRTFARIFVARTVPKYPRAIAIAPSALQALLVGLAQDPDPATRADRQLAAEYLLSAYTPHESSGLRALFERAGFFRILRAWHRAELRWPALLLAHLHDPDLAPAEQFASAEDILAAAARANAGAVPDDVLETLAGALPRILELSLPDTARFVDAHVPALHARALEALGTHDARRFAYLRYLLVPPPSSADADPDADADEPARAPSAHVAPPHRALFVDLQCRLDPAGTIAALRRLPRAFVEPALVVRTCEAREVFDAAMWALDRAGKSAEAVERAETFGHTLGARVGRYLAAHGGQDLEARDGQEHEQAQAPEQLERWVAALQAVGRMGVTICVEHSGARAAEPDPGADGSVPVADMWFCLLRSQIELVQSVSACCTAPPASPGPDAAPEADAEAARTVAALRALVQETFAALVGASAGRAVSFPRLFTRLVDATSRSARGTPYTEFRAVLTGMLDAYRFEGDMLGITRHLLDRDVFETVADVARERARGWAPARGVCTVCRLPVTKAGEGDGKIIVVRTGALYHGKCAPASLVQP